MEVFEVPVMKTNLLVFQELRREGGVLISSHSWMLKARDDGGGK